MFTYKYCFCLILFCLSFILVGCLSPSANYNLHRMAYADMHKLCREQWGYKADWNDVHKGCKPWGSEMDESRENCEAAGGEWKNVLVNRFCILPLKQLGNSLEGRRILIAKFNQYIRQKTNFELFPCLSLQMAHRFCNFTDI